MERLSGRRRRAASIGTSFDDSHGSLPSLHGNGTGNPARRSDPFPILRSFSLFSARNGTLLANGIHGKAAEVIVANRQQTRIGGVVRSRKETERA
jgi:hypothetical protein